MTSTTLKRIVGAYEEQTEHHCSIEQVRHQLEECAGEPKWVRRTRKTTPKIRKKETRKRG